MSISCDILRTDPERFGDFPKFGARLGEILQSLPCLAEFEKQLALRLGRADLDQAPGFDDVILYVSPDPPDGIGDESVALVGIKLLHGMHEADVAFLNEIGELESVVPIFMGDLDDEPQVRDDEFFRRFHIIVLHQSYGKAKFLIRSQNGKAVDLRNIEIECPGYSGNFQSCILLMIVFNLSFIHAYHRAVNLFPLFPHGFTPRRPGLTCPPAVLTLRIKRQLS